MFPVQVVITAGTTRSESADSKRRSVARETLHEALKPSCAACLSITFTVKAVANSFRWDSSFTLTSNNHVRTTWRSGPGVPEQRDQCALSQLTQCHAEEEHTTKGAVVFLHSKPASRITYLFGASFKDRQFLGTRPRDEAVQLRWGDRSHGQVLRYAYLVFSVPRESEVDRGTFTSVDSGVGRGH
ncbi:hypothetical protein EXIGLDRAFT_697739 [Exidia glandulosa HHB12029]|uniref:Uncharacterized protein n=1 Tax=Exidia glandulosa HHB12029 TaxID=1314781 RepID=A0A165ZZU7_EXIGL|nr:hypothetical protein EXIGLDRAFT_697739 [Exidia glandulosa HHB12029]